LKKTRKTIAALSLLFLFLVLTAPAILPTQAQVGIYSGAHDGSEKVSWPSELYLHWNYRVKITVSEPNIADRVNEPVSIYLTFPSGTARENLFRVMFYNGSSWIDVPTQVWNVTSSLGFVSSATITFLVNISKGATSTYYLYYTDDSLATMPTYYNYVTHTNGTFKSPLTNVDINYTYIVAQNYSAKVAWEYGFLTDFIVNGEDLFGEFWRGTNPIEVGDIVDCNNKWREEVRNLPYDDLASLVNFTSGPVFTQISLSKTTSYLADITVNRTWTFYPNFWTLDTVIGLGQVTQKVLVYGRSFHNGSETYSETATLEGDANVIDGSTITVKYLLDGQISVKSATIDGVGRAESMDTYGIAQAYWFAVYKSATDGFSYSCIPTSESLADINYFNYYDDLGVSDPYHYGAAGWGYYDPAIDSSKLWSATLVYIPHPPESSYDFAEGDYNRIYNPLQVQVDTEREAKIHNLVRFTILDELGNPVYNVTVKLYNSSSDTLVGVQSTNLSGIAVFTRIVNTSTYNVSIYYPIGDTLYFVNEQINLSFEANFTRTADFSITCNLRPLNVKLIDGKTGLALYNYSILINSTSNNINTSAPSDASGWHNFTLLTSPSSIYEINVSSPEGVLLEDNVSTVNISETQIVIINVTQTKFLTRLTLIYLNYTDTPGTISGGRSADLDNQYIEIYYGDKVNITAEFYNTSATPSTPITDANISEWEIFYETTLLSSGNLTHWSSGKYNITLDSADYGSNWGKTLTIKLFFSRDGGIDPPEIVITLKIKMWDTQLTYYPTYNSSIENDIISNYWRENITIGVDYLSLINATGGYLDLPEANFYIQISDASLYTYTIENYLGENGTVLIKLNLTDSGIGLYHLTLTANSTFYAPQEVTIEIAVRSVPTYGFWNSTIDFQLDNGGGTIIVRGALGEIIPVNITAYANETFLFPESPLTQSTGTYVWDKGSGDIREIGNGVYSFNISLEGLTDNDVGGYLITTILTKENYSHLVIYIQLDLIDVWPTQVDLVEIEPTNVYWGNNITLTLYYNSTLAPRAGNPLENATLIFDWPSGYWYYEDLGNGYYKVIFNSSAYTLAETFNPYSRQVTISKTFYGSNSTDATFGIIKIFSALTMYADNKVDPSEINVIVTDNENITVEFRVTAQTSIFYDDLITGANVTGVIVNTTTGETVDSAQFVEYDTGLYRLQINSSELVSYITSPVSFTLKVYAEKPNYHQQDYPQIYNLTINLIPSSLNVLDAKAIESDNPLADIPIGDHAVIILKFEDEWFGGNILNVSPYLSITCNWPYTFEIYDFSNINGTYQIILTTEEITSYELLITITKPNYEPQTLSLSVSVRPISVSFSFTGVQSETGTIEAVQGETTVISLTLVDADHNLPITSAEITLVITRDGEAISSPITLEHVGNGVYSTEISPENLEGAYVLVFQVDLPGNYEETLITQNLFIRVQVPWLLIGIIFGVFAAAIPAGYKAYRYYQWVKLPITVKRIIETVGLISKEELTEVGVARSRDDLINANVSEILSPVLGEVPVKPPITALPLEERMSTELAELRELINKEFFDLPETEREAMVKELFSLPPEERETTIQSLIESRESERQEIVKEGEILEKETIVEEELGEVLDKLVEEEVITEEEKLILLEELKNLKPEDRKEFLDKLRERRT